ncbi:MAG TPA: PEP-CTERM sorting domain-containing protein [Gemmataceae bacterium]|jgi:MYXO-CTERM domain-containing protein
MIRRIATPLAFLLLTLPARAQVVTVTRIADTTTLAPGGATFTSFGLFPNLDGSTVAFYGTAGGSSAIYAGTGGAVSTLVPAGAANPNGGTFTSYNQSFRYDGGSAVFVGTGGTASPGVFTSNGTTTTRFADANTAIPGGTGNFTGFSPFPSLSSGTAAFSGSGASSQQGVYTSTGGATPAVSLVADKNTAVPGGANGNFTAIGSNPSISGTTVVFRAGFGGSSLNGVYQKTGAGPLTTVADSNTPLPNGSGNFSTTFFEPTASGSNVSFINNNGVYALLGGTLKTIADASTPSPNGTGNFTTISAYAPISGTNIAFIGNTATSKGIYLYDGTALHTLIDNTNPTFDGKTLATTPFFLGPDGIDGNQVAFGVSFTTPSSTGVYRATFTPVPEPSALALVGVAALAPIRRRRKPLAA